VSVVRGAIHCPSPDIPAQNLLHGVALQRSRRFRPTGGNEAHADAKSCQGRIRVSHWVAAYWSGFCHCRSSADTSVVANSLDNPPKK
jgi:hypothetical protein